MIKSKVIQISTCSVDNNSSTQCSFITTALCEDGTIWQRFGFNDMWEPILQGTKEPIKGYYDK